MNASAITGPLQTPIAIVGVAALFPGSAARHGFWTNILAGRDLTSDVPEGHWLIADYHDPDQSRRGKTYARRGAFLPKVPFDPLEFGMPPASLPATDTAQLLALLVARQVLEDALGKDFAGVRLDRASVILGVASATELVASMAGSIQRPVWVKAMRSAVLPESQVTAICDRIENEYSDWTEATFPGLLGNVVAGRVANRFNFGGTNCVVDAACASSLAAVRMAVQELETGASDLAITGGVDAINDIFMYMCFSKTPAMSPTGDCRPFSTDADGTLLGEGLGMLALRRLADAERDGNRIYAVIRGIGSSSDGRAKSIYAPRAEGQALALQRAYMAAGYGPGTVELMEAHGTGTVAGDAAEVAALRDVFSKDRGDAAWCALGSVKSQIGHTKAAAGAASLYKTVMALHHKVLPPTCKVSAPNPALKLEGSPFYLNTRARPWVRGGGHPRRASVSSFGFGGSNFHLTIEEYTGAAPRPARIRPEMAELFLFSGPDTAALQQQMATMRAAVQEIGFAAAAQRSQASFDASAARRAAVVAGAGEFEARLDSLGRVLAGELPSAPGVRIGGGPPRQGRVAFLFPGQGSQYTDMGAAAMMAFPAAQNAWDRAAADVEMAGLHQHVFPPPVFTPDEEAAQTARLTATEVAQPAVGLTSLIFLALLREAGITADMVAGHSFGEITALFAAGAMDEDAFRRVARTRGVLMAEAAASTPGAMVVALTDRATAAEIAAGIADLGVANHNAPRQCVLAGTVAAIDAALAAFKARGITAKRLNVATAFHSPIVAAAATPFAAALETVAMEPPRVPVYANTTAAPYPTEPGAIRAQLAQQIAAPVEFVAQIQAMYEAGVRTFIEVGPGAVLTELVRQSLSDPDVSALAVDARASTPLAAFWDVLGQCAVWGWPVNTTFAWDGTDLAGAVIPPAPARAVMIDGANYAKPYPPPGGAAALPPPNPEKAQEPAVSHDARPAPLLPVDETTITALERIHAETAAAHRVAQQAMADAHIAYMRAAEQAFAQIGGLRTGAPVLPMAAPKAASPPTVTPAAQLRAAEPAIVPQIVPAPPAPARSAMPSAPAAAPPPVAPAPAPVAVSADPQRLFMAIVAEKTGYPVEMLNPDMAMEADLGIDSIKRVEILSELQSRIPALQDIDARELSALPTLGSIIDHVRQMLGTSSGAVAAPPPTAAHSSGAPAARGPVVEIPTAGAAEGLFFSVVAGKTGYPREMLKREMELEADLGIDSIKRVEILSELQQRIPVLEDLDARELAGLPTLGSIVDRVAQQMGLAEGGAATRGMAEAPSHGPATLVRMEHLWEAQRAPGEASAGLGLGSRVLVLALTPGTAADAVAEQLAVQGMTVAREAGEVAKADAVVLLAGSATDDRAVVARAFELARKFATRTDRGGRGFIVIQPAGAVPDLAGLCRTAAHEWPDVGVRFIALDEAVPAQHVIHELLTGGTTPEVRLGHDWARRVRSEKAVAPAGASTRALTDRPVLVVTGGGRGVTAACLIALARQRPLRLAILQRTLPAEEPPEIAAAGDMPTLIAAGAALAQRRGESLPPMVLSQQAQAVLAGRTLRATVAALEEAGAEVLTLAADVTRADAVTAATAAIRSHFGRIDGIVHGAGVLADSLLSEKTEAQVLRVYDTKVAGLRHLLQATAADELRLLAVFSSVAARYGNPGQGDYAVANATVCAMATAAAAERGAACALRIIDWGPWDGGMVNDGLRALFAARGVPLIPLAAGAEAFAAEVLQDRSASHAALFANGTDAPLGVARSAAAKV